MVSADVERPTAEVLDFGPRTTSRRRRLTAVLAVIVLALAAAALGLSRWWPQAPDFTLADLQGVYTGMVRSDGTNDMSTINRAELRPVNIAVTPARCAPLFSTLANHIPAHAIDGVSTYWIDTPVTTSLVSYRYGSADDARQDLRNAGTVLSGCLDQPVTLVDGMSREVTLSRLATSPADGRSEQLGFSYLYSDAAGRWDIRLLQQTNTLTWEFSYDASGRSDLAPGQRLLDALNTLMRSVQDAKQG